jgi:hypothetical protein
VPDRANRNMVTAGPRFERENTESVRYLRELAQANDVDLS